MSKSEERLEALHESLVAKTEALTTSEGWLAWLRVAERFHHYSLNNQLLILVQRPEATQVAGYGVWQSLGRQVRKGEKSIGIFAPMVRKKRDEDTGEEKRFVSGFRVVSVFDISQTDGEDVPLQPRPALLDGEAPAGLWDALAAVVGAHGYTLERGDCRGANGYTSPSTKTVKVREDVSEAQAVKTLAHEVAHMLMHCEDADLSADAIRHRAVAEVEAESVAYLVANSHGLPTDDYTLPYVAGWSDGKTEVVAATADRVLKTARTILAATAPAEVPEVTEAA